MKIVIAGLAITSSWGNGHATTYRGLVRELARAGHHVLFLERDVEWYRDNRDTPRPEGCRVGLYGTFGELCRRFEGDVRDADAVIVGSYVPEGVDVGRWVTRTARGTKAFYDIDTPVTLAKLERGDEEYISRDLVPRYDVYLSFTGGPTLERIERRFGSPCARALYCSVDADLYQPIDLPMRWDLGYIGTYSDDRQPVLDRLLVEPARRLPKARFAVVGPSYPGTIAWPRNVERELHLSPREHPAFYCAQRYTLNVTRADMVRAGFSPSVRLFEAAACGTPIISDVWEGIGTFFEPGSEILLARSPDEVVAHLQEVSDEERFAIGRRARARVLERHTAAHRARELLSALTHGGL